MKFLSGAFLIIITAFTILNSASGQNYNWITPGKTYLKMYVTEDGMYRINKTDFNNAGINVTDIDPRTVKVLNLGQQIPIFFSGEQDGIFNDNDYLDFYGKRKYGGLTNTYTETNTVLYTTDEYFDLYSDTNFYWIEWGGSNGLRFSTNNFTTSELFLNNFFNDVIHFEYDNYYTQGENNSSLDYRFLSTEKYRGEGWYWKLLGNNQYASDTFSIPSLYDIAQTCSLKLFAYPTGKNDLVTNEHTLQILVNGTLVSTLYSNDYKRFDTTVSFSSSLLYGTIVNTVAVVYVPAAGTSGGVHFDFFEIQYPKKYNLQSSKLYCKTGVSDTTSKQFKITGFNSSNPVNIYDVGNNYKISAFTFNGDTLKFTGKSNGQFEIVNSLITKKPARIRQRIVPSLASTSNGADYLVIYNSMFTSQAEQLRAYRQSRDNFRSVKAEIEDIYDIFNYGIENPVAVRNFTKYVNDNWQLPKLQYICLFGRGSLDPKKNYSSSVYYKNLIPVYGYPPSDGYFANMNIGTFIYYDQISIGRLPAYTVSEAQTIVDKIISYENQTTDPSAWWKTFTYITGGGTTSEQQQHQVRSNFEINTYVLPQSISGNPVKIYRTDTSGSNTYNIADSVKNTFNRGSFFVNFRGHAGSHDWEVIMNDPNILSNGSKLPIILSLTCFTGENSKPDFRGFGERFIYLPNKGAIGFVGTTGWSFGSSGNDFGTYIIQSMKVDTARRIGNFVKTAGKTMSADSTNFNTRHTVNCYNLLGDPASLLVLPKYPEFLINNNDYKLSDAAPDVKENTVLTIYPKNYGLYADSCKIRFQLFKNNVSYSIKDTVIRAFRFSDSVKHVFKLDTAGIYEMAVKLDADNWYTKEIEDNNIISIVIPTKNNTYIPVSPVDNSIVYKDSVELTGLNPNLNSGLKTAKVFAQLDTTMNFSSPLLRTFINNSVKGAVTKFSSAIPVTVNNTIYYWRTRSLVNNDSSGWSKVQRFVYNNGIADGDGKMRFINSENRVELSKFRNTQFSETDFINTEFTGNGIKLIETPSRLFVRSYGSNGEEASYFSVGNTNIYIDGGQNTGLNLIKVKKLTGKVLAFKNFKMTSTTSSDSLVSFLNTYDTTHYLMLLNAAYVPGGRVLSTQAKNKLRQFGSIYCDSIGLMSYFHSWSLIGSLGATQSEVCESFDPCCRTSITCTSCDHWSEAICTKEVTFTNSSGTVSNVIGPAQTWTDFSWKQIIFNGSDLYFDVIGIDRLNNQSLVIGDIRSNEFADISKIDAKIYPKLILLAKFSIDTANGTRSSVLISIKVNYTPATELVLDRKSFSTGNMNAKSNDNTLSNFSFDYFNSGFAYIYGTIVNVFNRSVSDSNLIYTDTVNSILKMDSMKNYSAGFQTPRFTDSTKIIVQIKPKDDLNEFYTYNNTFEYSLFSERITASVNAIEIFADGKKLNTGDNLRKNPEIKVNLLDKTKDLSFNDTSAIIMKLNDVNVPVTIRESSKLRADAESKIKLKTVINDNSITFYPELKNGNNKISVIYKHDDSDSDTLYYDVIVGDIAGINDLYNFPNPMKSETNFIFNLTGQENTGNLKIKIYTVSGRVIRELEYPFSIGYNQIPWDGKDSDGDFVANGTYLYKVSINNGTEIESGIQKLVVLR